MKIQLSSISEQRSRFLIVLPFLALFLYSAVIYVTAPPYQFGTDDAFYYSYVSSIFIDHDLNLADQYELSGLTKLNPDSVNKKTATGRTQNIYPAGLSLFWAPFFIAGKLTASVLRLPMNGYSRPFLLSVGIGNLMYVCLGLFFSYLFCRFWTSNMVALFSTFALLLTTPYLLFYFRSFVLVSEPLSFALAAFLFYFVRRFEQNASLMVCFYAGLIIGAMTMVRLHNILFGLVPILVFHFKGRNLTAAKIAAFLLGAFLGFLPQLIIWRLLNGSWSPEFGEVFLPWWKQPFILETLFSSRKGLFPWCPVLIFCIPGLFLFWKKERAWGIAFLLVIFFATWLNSAQTDWWGSTSLGARRFVPLTPIFAAGLGILLSRLKAIFQSSVVLIVILLVLLNFHFVKSYRRGLLSYEHADRFSDILRGIYAPYKCIVYPLQFPVQLQYRAKYGTAMYAPTNEFFIGEDVFYFQNRVGNQLVGQGSPLFGSGWKWDGVRKTSGSAATLYVPMFMKETPRLLIQFDFDPVTHQNDIWIDFFWNGDFLRSRQVFANGRMIEIAIRPQICRHDVNELQMRIYRSRKKNVDVPELILRKMEFFANEIGSHP